MKINKKGFTLIELLIVVAIIGMLSFVSIGAFLNMSRTRTYLNAVNEVDSIIKEAHAYAIASRAQAGARDVIDASVSPIGVYIPLNNSESYVEQSIIIFQDVNNDNDFAVDEDEIITRTSIVPTAAIKADPESSASDADNITLMYQPPSAKASLYYTSKTFPVPKVSFIVVDHFGNHKKANAFTILQSTGIHVITKR